MKINQHVALASYLAVFIALSDQLSKWWLMNIVMREPHVEVVTSYFNLVMVE